jgi:hypothetical protein
LSAQRLEAARRIPSKLMLAVVAASLILREFFPFSWFPMYSQFSGRTWYVYVADDRDRPIAIRERFGVSAPFLKKAFNSNLRAARGSISHDSLPAESEAAVDTLRFITTKLKPKHAEAACVDLRLWKVELERRDREIARQRRFLGELRCP